MVLYLPYLYPDAPDFDLAVNAAQELDITIKLPFAKVTGAVKKCLRRVRTFSRKGSDTSKSFYL